MKGNQFKVLPNDEKLASNLHGFIVTQSKVLTALSKQATEYFQEGDIVAAEHVYKRLAAEQHELMKAYRDLSELRKKYINTMMEAAKLDTLIGQANGNIHINIYREGDIS